MINQETKKIFTYDEFVLMHGGVNLIQFNKLISALELLLTKYRFNINNLEFTSPPRPAWLAFFNITKKGCSGWTRLLRVYRSDNIRLREIKWEGQLGKIMGPIFWDKTHKNLGTIKYNNKWKWFQYNINRGCLKVNSIICNFVTNQTDRCTFCHAFREDILHLFWVCERVQAFYRTLIPFLTSINIPWPPPDRELFLFGNPGKSFLSEVEYIYLLIRYFIWANRCLKNDLSVDALKNKIKSDIHLDLHYYGRRGDGGQLIPTNEQFEFLGCLAEKLGIG